MFSMVAFEHMERKHMEQFGVQLTVDGGAMQLAATGSCSGTTQQSIPSLIMILGASICMSTQTLTSSGRFWSISSAVMETPITALQEPLSCRCGLAEVFGSF